MKRGLWIFIIILALVAVAIAYVVTRPNYEVVEYQDLSQADDPNGLFCLGLYNSDFSGKEFVINTQEEYSALQYDIPDGFCKDFVPPQIDFTQKTLLGRSAGGSGCTIEFKKEVLKDAENKKIIFSIKVIEQGSCEVGRMSMNWVLIPKVPQDYAVKFLVT